MSIPLGIIDVVVVGNALTIAGFSSGILVGLFALGVFTKRTYQTAALGGAAIGLITMLFLQFGLPNVPGGFKLAFPWLAECPAIR